MRKLLPVILFLFLFVRPVWADYQSAYNDYSYNYTLYRTAYNDYQVSKSTYLTYHTLTAQADAVNKLRAVLKARDQVMFVYYNLLQEKLNATAGVADTDKTTFGRIKDSENSWLTSHQTKIDAAASLDDLNSVSAEFETRYPQMDTEIKQTIGTILIAKENTLESRVDATISNLKTKVTEIRKTGDDTTFADRGAIDTKNKLDLFNTKLTEAHTIFYPKNTFTAVDLFAGQQKLAEANQYLREAVNFLLEIVKSFTG